MTSTEIKKLNAYPEWNTLPTYIQVMNYIQSINEDEEPEYPPNLNYNQKKRYKEKFSKDFIVEPYKNEPTIFYQPYIQENQQNQRIKIPVARPNQHLQILSQIYNDDKLGLGIGLDQFYYQVCSQYIGIKRIEARTFLRKQGNYQISRPIKKAINQPILSKTPNEIWGMDITYMTYLQVVTKKNEEGIREPREIDPITSGVTNVANKLTKNLNQFNQDGTEGYILTIVDFFSKKVWARALTQNNAEQVLTAFKSVCNETRPPTYCHILITDNGGEFVNENMKDFCKEKKIIHKLAKSYTPTTNGLTERMNREIRKKIKAGFIRNNNLEWFSHLQTYCDNINNQRQSTTGYKPIELWKAGYKPVRKATLPNPDLKPNDFSNDKQLRQRIEARIVNKASAILKNQKIKKLQIGDKVRIKLTAIDSKHRKRNKDKMEKKKNVITYSPKVYEISRLVNDKETPNNIYQSNDPFKRLKYYLKYQDNGEWKELGTQKGNRFQPISFFRSDLWYVPTNYIEPNVTTKKRADIINFFTPYPAINQEQLDEEERLRQEEERQRIQQLNMEREEQQRLRHIEQERQREQREQLRLRREELQKMREEEAEQVRQQKLQRQMERQQQDEEEEEKRKQRQEEIRQKELKQERKRRLKQLEEERKNQQYEKITRTGRTAKPNSRYL